MPRSANRLLTTYLPYTSGLINCSNAIQHCGCFCRGRWRTTTTFLKSYPMPLGHSKQPQRRVAFFSISSLRIHREQQSPKQLPSTSHTSVMAAGQSQDSHYLPCSSLWHRIESSDTYSELFEQYGDASIVTLPYR